MRNKKLRTHPGPRFLQEQGFSGSAVLECAGADGPGICDRGGARGDQGERAGALTRAGGASSPGGRGIGRGVQGAAAGPFSGALVGAAIPTNCVTLLLKSFAVHTLPEASIAIPIGSLRPPPWNPVDGESGLPLEFSSEMLPTGASSFVIQMLFAESDTRLSELLMPPPVKPPEPDIGVPLVLNSVTLALPMLVVHGWPAGSIVV